MSQAEVERASPANQWSGAPGDAGDPLSPVPGFLGAMNRPSIFISALVMLASCSNFHGKPFEAICAPQPDASSAALASFIEDKYPFVIENGLDDYGSILANYIAERSIKPTSGIRSCETSMGVCRIHVECTVRSFYAKENVRYDLIYSMLYDKFSVISLASHGDRGNNGWIIRRRF